MKHLMFEQFNDAAIQFLQPSYKDYKLFALNDKNANVPIIIDYGVFQTKAGWGNSSGPNLTFRTIISKNRDAKKLGGEAYLVGNQIKEFDYQKLNYLTPYERNIMQHFGQFEHLNDYIFGELGIQQSSVNHPMMVTECVGNPISCRQQMLEYFFEAYQVPAVLIGIDPLFSYYYHVNQSINQPDFKQQNAKEQFYGETTSLITHIGATCIHIIPVLKGVVQYGNIKRINIGSMNTFEYLQKSLVLKYPLIKHLFTLNVLENINLQCVQSALNYTDQLNYFHNGIQAFQNKNYKDQITYQNNIMIQQQLKEFLEPVRLEFAVYTPPIRIISEEEEQRIKFQRQEQSRRFKEALEKKRQEKQQQNEQQLRDLLAMLALKQEDPHLFTIKLEQMGMKKHDELNKAIKQIKIKLGLITQDELEFEKYNLINIPDNQLLPEQKTRKKMQIFQKQAALARAEKKILEAQRKEAVQKLKDSDPQQYMEKLYEKRHHYVDRLKQIRKERIEQQSRGGRAAKQRMQVLAQLGAQSQSGTRGKKATDQQDDFGQKDDDWDVYKHIQKGSNSDEENYETKLQEVDLELREIDKHFEENTKTIFKNPHQLLSQNNYVDLKVELVKGPEMYFQPNIIGIDQLGLADAIHFVLRQYEPDIQKDLLKSIYLCGGGARTLNLKERLVVEIQSNSQKGTEINIIKEGSIYDNWNGMQLFSSLNDVLKYSITKKEYNQYGSAFFKENPFSNKVSFNE